MFNKKLKKHFEDQLFSHKLDVMDMRDELKRSIGKLSSIQGNVNRELRDKIDDLANTELDDLELLKQISIRSMLNKEKIQELEFTLKMILKILEEKKSKKK